MTKTPDNDQDDDELAALLIDFETQLGTGDRSTHRSDDRLSRASEASLRRLADAKECLLWLDEIWPHPRSIDDPLPEAIGRFRIVRELGHGGFGIVYLAADEQLARRGAEVQRPETILSAPLRQRFLREAKAAARLVHPHIAGIHDVGEAGIQVWIASEYVAGDSLAVWLRRVNPP